MGNCIYPIAFCLVYLVYYIESYSQIVENVFMQSHYWLTRLFYIRGLGVIYFIIAVILFLQGPQLIGPEGLTPVSEVTQRLLETEGSIWPTFWKYPSVLFLNSTNSFLMIMSGLFFAASLMLITGLCNIPLLLLLWFLQLSLVNGAGRFYSFGWETMMLEMTLMACLFVHPWRLNLMSKKYWAPHYWAIFPLLWMMFRLMLGAGLIKIRGDVCWLDFSCMNYHYQTQPNPHFLSWYFHHLPTWFHQLEVGLTHFCELLVPFLFLLTRRVRIVGGIIIILFQFTLISTGNLAFINWLTIVLALLAFDDQFLVHFIRKSKEKSLKVLQKIEVNLIGKRITYVFLIAIAFLSYKPVANMISPSQRMNESYDGYHLVNSYGLFGSITKKRYEIIISGTRSPTLPASNQWQEYEFYCKPGAIDQRPCWVTPYHLRLDWQMWFSAMRPKLQENWLATLASKMLVNDAHLQSLLRSNPFVGGEPPQFIKMDLYLYEYTDWGDPSGNWWKRQYVSSYLPAISLRNFKK